MKININNVLYIQRKDLKHLKKQQTNFPRSISTKKELENINTINDKKFLKIDNKQLINYINQVSYILDYDEYINMSEEELSTIARRHYQLLLEAIENYNAAKINPKTNLATLEILYKNFLELKYIKEDSKELYLYKQNKIKILFPNEIDDQVERPKNEITKKK